MAIFRKKHRVLKMFYLQKTNNPYEDYFPPDIVKACLTTDDIQNKLKYKIGVIDSICHALKIDGYITVFHDNEFDPHGISTFYIITDDGKKAYLEKTYLRNLFKSFVEFWIPILAFIVSVIAIIIAIVK